MESAIKDPYMTRGYIVDGTTDEIDFVVDDSVGGPDGRGGKRREREETVVIVEGEELERGGACAEREVEDVLGGRDERASGEEERRREERMDWFGNEGEGCVVRTWDPCKAVYGYIVWEGWDQVRVLVLRHSFQPSSLPLLLRLWGTITKSHILLFLFFLNI